MFEQNLTPEQKKALQNREGAEGSFISSETEPAGLAAGKKPIPNAGGSLSKFPKPTQEQMLEATRNQPVPREVREKLSSDPDQHKQYLTELINQGKVSGNESEIANRVMGMDSSEN